MLPGPLRSPFAIVSLRIPRADWVRVTEPSVALYAERHGLDVVNLRSEKLDLSVLKWRRRFRNLHLEKFQLHDLLVHYERVLYLDADVLIHPEAPNIFEQVSTGAIGVVNEQLGAEAPKREQEWHWMQRRLGALDATPGRYFNAGMMVASQTHRPLFAYKNRNFAAGRWPDQNSLNYYAHRLRLSVEWLGPEWNCMPVFPAFHQPEQRRKAWFIHYAGEPAKAALREDLRYFEGQSAWVPQALSAVS